MLYIVFCFTCTKVKGSSTSLKNFVAKNEQVKIDNMDATTTVGNIKKSSAKTYANGKDETDLPRVPDRLVGTSKSDMGINAMDDTVFAATAIDVVQLKGMISFIFFVEQFQVPMEFLIISLIVCLIAFVKFCKPLFFALYILCCMFYAY